MVVELDELGVVSRMVGFEVDTASGYVAPLIGVRAEPDQQVIAGRQGDLPVGVVLDDRGVSRRALLATPRPEGWEIEFNNVNGAWVQPWAQGAAWRKAGTVETVCWPRIAVRIVGTNKNQSHWVLLESDRYGLPPPGDPAAHLRSPRTDLTVGRDVPAPLTDKQLEAARAVFGEYLAWPPTAAPTAALLKTAARRIGVAEGSLKDRLSALNVRAQRLGLPGQFALTHVEPLLHCAAHGYIAPPPPMLPDVTYR